MKDRNDYDVSCPLCWAPELADQSLAQGNN
jgi:hypothetical protein